MPTRLPLITIGYEGRTAGEIVAQLREENVSVLVDVRLTPLSRKPGLSKQRLADTLANVGIGYRHLPALGNPKDNRDGLRAGDPRSRRRFRALLRSATANSALTEVETLAKEGRVALLCFERDAEACHRHLVVDELEHRAETTLAVVHG